MTKKEQKYINSLKEENERVKNLLLRFVDAIGKLKNLDDVVNVSLMPLMTEENQKIRAEIKAEAIKEFEEKIYSASFPAGYTTVYGGEDVQIRHIEMASVRAIAKEMVGE